MSPLNLTPPAHMSSPALPVLKGTPSSIFLYIEKLIEAKPLDWYDIERVEQSKTSPSIAAQSASTLYSANCLHLMRT
jgi:hypothetical protein